METTVLCKVLASRDWILPFLLTNNLTHFL